MWRRILVWGLVTLDVVLVLAGHRVDGAAERDQTVERKPRNVSSGSGDVVDSWSHGYVGGAQDGADGHKLSWRHDATAAAATAKADGATTADAASSLVLAQLGVDPLPTARPSTGADPTDEKLQRRDAQVSVLSEEAARREQATRPHERVSSDPQPRVSAVRSTVQGARRPSTTHADS